MNLSDIIFNWFIHNKRDLPWRGTHNPYHVLVSEVMLQQTQAAVVIPYFVRWIQQFPTLHALAQASEQEVLKAWEGLGYYSRAKRLHQAARHIVDKHEGLIPSHLELLEEIAGIGPYTAAAIVNFAFQKKACAVDGNVMRVMSRLFGIQKVRQEGKKILLHHLSDLLEHSKPWVISEALIELGALVCQKKPLCQQCPLQPYCYAYTQDSIDSFPQTVIRPKITFHEHTVGLIYHGDCWMLLQGQKGRLLQDVYEFPYTQELFNHVEAIELYFSQRFNLALTYQGALESTHQSYTRYKILLKPYLLKSHQPFVGHSLQQLQQSTLSAGHKRILQCIEKKAGDGLLT